MSRSTVRYIVATLLRHPPLIEEFCERLADLEIEDGRIDGLMKSVLSLVHDAPGLDEEGLKSHLIGADAELADDLLRAEVYAQWRFAGPDATMGSAREGVSHALVGLGLSSVRAELAKVQKALEVDPNEADVERLVRLKSELEVLSGEEAMSAGDSDAGAALKQIR